MRDYERRLRREAAFYGFPWFPLMPPHVAELERRKVSISDAFKVACDVANGFDFHESLKANLRED